MGQTSCSPVIPSWYRKYLLVAYAHNPNTIIIKKIKSHSIKDLLHAYTIIYQILKTRGLAPIFKKYNNEYPEAFKTFLHKKVLFQCPTPYEHRTKPAEKAIDTFKCHFIVCLTSVNLLPPSTYSVASSWPPFSPSTSFGNQT